MFCLYSCYQLFYHLLIEKFVIYILLLQINIYVMVIFLLFLLIEKFLLKKKKKRVQLCKVEAFSFKKEYRR